MVRYGVAKGLKYRLVRRTPKAQLVATPATMPTRHLCVALLSSKSTRTIIPRRYPKMQPMRKSALVPSPADAKTGLRLMARVRMVILVVAGSASIARSPPSTSWSDGGEMFALSPSSLPICWFECKGSWSLSWVWVSMSGLA